MALIPYQRHLFDIPYDIAYFNCAYQGPQLKASTEALIQGVHSKSTPWTCKPIDFFEAPENFRHLMGKVTGAPASNFAICPSASYGMTLAARSIEPSLQPGDEILMIAETFPSTYLTWKRTADETGAVTAMVDAPDDHDWTRAILERISPATRVLSLPHIHWGTGAMIDVEAIADAAHENGIWLVFDLTQSIFAIPFDFDRIKPDFVAIAGYKWALFPYGLSTTYVDPKWHSARPIEETWMNREGAHIFEKLAQYSDQYQLGARRFDMGEKSLPTLIPGGIAALKQISEWGVSNIQDTLRHLTSQIAEFVADVGLTPVPETCRSPNILGASSTNGLPEGLLPALAAQNIYISQRGNSLRFAPYLHSSDADMKRLEAALRSAF